MDDTEDDWAAQMANPDGKVKPMSLEEAIDLIAWRLQRTREERENIVGKIIAYEEALSLLRNMGANAELTGGAHRAS